MTGNNGSLYSGSTFYLTAGGSDLTRPFFSTSKSAGPDSSTPVVPTLVRTLKYTLSAVAEVKCAVGDLVVRASHFKLECKDARQIEQNQYASGKLQAYLAVGGLDSWLVTC